MTDTQPIPTDPQALAEAVGAAMWSRDRTAQALGMRIEHVVRRQLHALAAELALGLIDARTQLQRGDDLVVDDRDDAIDLDRALRGLHRQGERCGDEADGEGDAGAGKGLFHVDS